MRTDEQAQKKYAAMVEKTHGKKLPDGVSFRWFYMCFWTVFAG